MDDEVQVPVIWVGVEDAQVVMSNQFMSSFEEGQFFLTFGHVTPPVILGTDEQREEQIRRLGYVPIKTLIRLSVTPAKLRDLIDVLETNLAHYRNQFPD